LFLFLTGQTLKDGKGIQGKGRLTRERIDSFQVFYGKALRDNKGDVDAMSHLTMAILKHYSDMPEEEQHADCPKGTESWCRHQVDKARDDGVITYIPIKKNISPVLYDILYPTFKALSDKKLLQACEMCKDQNANESLHSVIWNVVPKDLYHSPQEVSLGINIAVGLYNDGQRATLAPLMEKMGISLPTSSTTIWGNMDAKRVKDAERRNTLEHKTQRKDKRKRNLRRLDAFSHVEGHTYKSGAFHSNMQTAKPRKARKCSKCGNPMKGHKKAACSTPQAVDMEDNTPTLSPSSLPQAAAVSQPPVDVHNLQPTDTPPAPAMDYVTIEHDER
jgi:hypothetical protein